MTRSLAPELTWTGERFEPDVRIGIGADGRIGSVTRAPDHDRERAAAPDLEELARIALIPGFVNAHSHAFQRGLRGAGESFADGAGSFWTWREAMYRLVEEMEPARFQRLAVQAYGEMRRAGITTVGEFHYLHHHEPEDYRFDQLILEAASEAGIHLVLLNAYYRTGGIGRELSGGQSRFLVPSPEAYWSRMDGLAERAAAQGAGLGAVVHSVRAADPGELEEIVAEARRRGLVLHLHLEEQRLEIEETLAAYGSTPMRLLLDRVDVGAWVTAVHCTHTEPSELRELLDAGARVCVCPLTEGNLGDGLPALAEAGVDAESLALGTDSNLRISMVEEMRWLEYGQRLRGERRGVLRDSTGAVGRALLGVATLGGARSLGIQAGTIEPGARADFAALDLDHPALAGSTPESLIDAFAFGGPDDSIAGTCVAGDWSWRARRDR